MKIHLERKSDKNRSLSALLIMNGDTGRVVTDGLALAGVLTTARGRYRPSLLFELHNRFPGLELVA